MLLAWNAWPATGVLRSGARLNASWRVGNGAVLFSIRNAAAAAGSGQDETRPNST